MHGILVVTSPSFSLMILSNATMISIVSGNASLSGGITCMVLRMMGVALSDYIQ
jgi:hypothetical protein